MSQEKKLKRKKKTNNNLGCLKHPFVYVPMGLKSLFGILEGNTKRSRGYIGEDDVNRVLILHSVNNKLHYKIIHNFVMKSPRVQVDTIYINKDGVFIIEVKNWTGRIVGKEDDDRWNRVIIRNGIQRSYQYLNPIKQNKSHVYKIKTILKPDIPIYSLIVFASNNARSLGIDNVVNITGMSRWLLNIKSNRELTDEEIDEIYQILIDNRSN